MMISTFILPTQLATLSFKHHSQHYSTNNPLIHIDNNFMTLNFTPTTNKPSSILAKNAISQDILRPTTVADEDDFPAGLKQEVLPRHVAFIADGNVRWAKRRGLGSEEGHHALFRDLPDFMNLCLKWGIQIATFFLFSYENWRRSKQETDYIMMCMEKMLMDGLQNFVRQGIRISTIGNTSMLPKSLQEMIEHAEEETKHNTKTHVILAVSYSGRNDIVEACRTIATKVTKGEIDPDDLTESVFQQELQTKIANIPCPDLVIRTSGEVRISNFLLWQMAYSEMYFTETLWPDFGEAEFVEALQCFQKRARRFGGR